MTTLSSTDSLPHLTSRNLAKELFKAAIPEQGIRAIPAQSLYMAIKENGLHSSTDLLEIATIQQCRLMLDFDCWERDRFNEDNFWEWLSLADDDTGLKFLQKLIKIVDLKLVALLISRYVKVEIFEEPTDEPPGPNYYTPDKGYTWLHITLTDSNRHFLFARLLALIFETDTKLFYQILSIPNVATETMLEEESYQEKERRLQGEGIPEQGQAVRINSAIDEKSIIAELFTAKKRAPVEDVNKIEPLIYDSLIVQPLGSLLSELSIREQCEVELSLILNAAIVYWKAEFYEHEAIKHLVQKVKGAVNIGLEMSMRLSGLSAIEVFKVLGFEKLYRFGLGQLKSLRILAKGISDDDVRAIANDAEKFAVIAGAREDFPEMPMFLKDDGSIIKDSDGTLSPGYRAIQSVQGVETIKKVITTS